MPEIFSIGLYTSAWGRVAWELIAAVLEAVKSGLILNAEITFLLCTREERETAWGDFVIRKSREAGIPVILFSSLRFKPEMRECAREANQRGDPPILNRWREGHDREIRKLVPLTDLDVLLGYMWQMSGTMCQLRDIINLHPALPKIGPKGSYVKVIWELITGRATGSGVMMHLVTEELDGGPAISFCRFPIHGGSFETAWEELSQRMMQGETLEEIKAREGEENNLFRLIREAGVKRESPLLLWTIKEIVEGGIKIKDGVVFDSGGKVLASGYNLTRKIDALVT